MTNPDAPQDDKAEAFAEAGSSEDAIAGAAQGFATEFDANGPFGVTFGALPTLPVLPTGFDWRVELKEHRDSTNLTDHSEYNGYDYSAWFWEDGRPICGHRHAIVFLRQNTVIIKQRTVQVEGLDTEFEFVTAVVEAANHLYGQHDADRRGWLVTDFPGLQEN